jgi:hypothetical protein
MAVDKAMPAAYPVLRNARLKGDSSASGPIPLVLSPDLLTDVNEIRQWVVGQFESSSPTTSSIDHS